MNLDNNLYIKLLEYGDNNPNGFTYQNLVDQIKLTPEEGIITQTFFINSFSAGETEDHLAGYSTNGSLQHHIVAKPVLDSIFTCLTKGKTFNENTSTYILNYDAYFNYVNYKDLKSTQFISYIALGMSILGIFLSIYFSIQQINISQKQLSSPIKIEPSQFKEIKDLVTPDYYTVE